MITLTETQTKILHKELKKTGNCQILGVVVINKKPARKGKINGAFGKEKIFAERLTAKFSRNLRDAVLKKVKKPKNKR